MVLLCKNYYDGVVVLFDGMLALDRETERRGELWTGRAGTLARPGEGGCRGRAGASWGYVCQSVSARIPSVPLSQHHHPITQ